MSENLSGKLLKSMRDAPAKPILAMHFEKGPVEISPDHEANYWLSHLRGGKRNWYFTDDPESGSFDDGDLDGWFDMQHAPASVQQDEESKA